MSARPLFPGPAAARTAAILAIGVFLLLWSAYEVLQPISNDQGVALWAGDVIHKGGVLYRDAWETRGPAPYYFTSLIVALFGRNSWGLRLVDLLIQAGAAWGIGALITKLGGTRVSAVAGAGFYLAWYASLQFQDSAQADGWVGALLLFTALVLLRKPAPTYRAMFASGLLLGICILNKPTYGLCVLLPAIAAARPPVTAGRWVARVLTAALGCILPIAVAVLYFWDKGALWTAYDAFIRYNVLVYGHLKDPWLGRLRDTSSQMLHLPMVLAWPLVIAGLVKLWRSDRYAATLVGWWLAAMLLSQMIQHKPWLYEWLPTLAPFAVLAGLALSRLPRSSTPGARRAGTAAEVTSPLLLAFAGLVLLAGALSPAHRVSKWVLHLLRGTPTAPYQESEYGEWGYHPGGIPMIAEYVRQRTAPGDPVIFFGLLPGGTFYAARPNPTRFGVVRPLFDVGPASASFGPRYRAEFMADVQQHVPKYVITYGDSVCGRARSPGDWRCTENFPEFRAWLLDHYVIDAVRGVFDVWRYVGERTPTLQPVQHG